MSRVAIVVNVLILLLGESLGMFVGRLTERQKLHKLAQEEAVKLCFAIYNDRPFIDGHLPWSDGAKAASDACFEEQRNMP